MRCPGIYYHCVITNFVWFVYLFAFISLFVKLPKNAIGCGILYQWSPVKHLLYMLKKNFPLIFWWINYIFLVSVMFQNKIATTYPSTVLVFFFVDELLIGGGGGCVLNMYFNDICLVIFFFFLHYPKTVVDGGGGGGNNFLHIYIYILENSCEG